MMDDLFFNDARNGVPSLSNMPLRSTTIDLSIANPGYILNASGKNFYIDETTTGSAFVDPVSLNVGVSDGQGAIGVTRKSFYQGNFQSLKISWARQPGGKLVILTGDFYVRGGDAVITPVGNSASVNAPPGSRFMAANVNLQSAVQTSSGNALNIPPLALTNPNFPLHAAVEVNRIQAAVTVKFPASSTERISTATIQLVSPTFNEFIYTTFILDAIVSDATGVYHYGRVDYTFPNNLLIPRNPNGLLQASITLNGGGNVATTVGFYSVEWSGFSIS
jgi:hypothetical protein